MYKDIQMAKNIAFPTLSFILGCNPITITYGKLRKYGIIWNPTSNEIKITSPAIKWDFN